ncbi:MAG TPA: SDR family oxidoreductase, partial [Thermoanaerobaculia bacterium]|nr:SDR family oxidoreductase [Thermoanaerobaculia bacterium]
MAESLDVAGALAGERVFVTGATGFVGKVLAEKLLWSVPEIGGLLLLVRPREGRSAVERLREDLFASPVFARLRARHGDGFAAWAAGRVEAVAGNLGRERFGLEEAAYRELCGRVDRVVACAATVTFDERLDRALSLNARGALRTLELARDAGGAPLVHVSTCFVSGRRSGPVAEELPLLGSDGDADPETVLAGLDAACAALADAGAEGDAPWVEAGAEAAARHGFHDVYTLTKALGERLIERQRGGVPVAVVRPAIVESALAEPFPGWMEGVKVVDPLLAAYGRGRTKVLPGAAGVPMELVPVDHVVAAVAAALADLGRGEDRLRVFQVGSSRHPITLGELMAHARHGFAATPLRDEDGEPIAVPPARFMAPDRLRGELEKRLARARGKGDAVGERTLEHFVRLIDVYRPYVSRGARYEDAHTHELWERLSPASRADFPFDVTAIDWPSYVARVHVPGLVRFALHAESGAPVLEELPALAGRYAAAAERASQASTLFELFESVARAHPEVMALQTYRDGRWLRYTYAQALAATANVAWRLATEHGVEPGNRVVLWSNGRPEWALAALAVHRLGATVVPLDPQWPAAEALAAARFVDARVALAMPPLVPALQAAVDAEPGGPPLSVVSLSAPFVPEPDVGLLPEAAGHADHRAGGEGDLATILFTSGTTSAVGAAPKAVPLTHGNYLANVRDLVPIMRLSRERLLSVLPVHHAFEQTVGFLVPLAGASTVSYVAEIRPQEISWMMQTTRPTMLVAVPRLLELLHGGIMANVEANGLQKLFKVLFALSRATGGRLGHKLFAKVHRRFGGSLRRIATGGSALRASLGRSFQLMGFEVAEGYGMTETAPVLTVNPWGELRFGSVG